MLVTINLDDPADVAKGLEFLQARAGTRSPAAEAPAPEPEADYRDLLKRAVVAAVRRLGKERSPDITAAMGGFTVGTVPEAQLQTALAAVEGLQ